MAAEYQERPYQPWPVLSRDPAGFWERWPFEPWPEESWPADHGRD